MSSESWITRLAAIYVAYLLVLNMITTDKPSIIVVFLWDIFWIVTIITAPILLAIIFYQVAIELYRASRRVVTSIRARLTVCESLSSRVSFVSSDSPQLPSHHWSTLS
jgi:hypothetical protein